MIRPIRIVFVLFATSIHTFQITKSYKKLTKILAKNGEKEESLSFQHVAHNGGVIEAGADERPAEAATAVYRGGNAIGVEALMGGIIATYDLVKWSVGVVDVFEILARPPEIIALFGQRFGGVEARMHKEQGVVLLFIGKGCAH